MATLLPAQVSREPLYEVGESSDYFSGNVQITPRNTKKLALIKLFLRAILGEAFSKMDVHQ